MMDTGKLPKRGGVASCGVCRGHHDVDGRREARREGWRYTQALGWLCPPCAMRAPAPNLEVASSWEPGTVPTGTKARARVVRARCGTCENKNAAALPRSKRDARRLGWAWGPERGWECAQCIAARGAQEREQEKKAATDAAGFQGRNVRGFGARSVGDIVEAFTRDA